LFVLKWKFCRIVNHFDVKRLFVASGCDSGHLMTSQTGNDVINRFGITCFLQVVHMYFRPICNNLDDNAFLLLRVLDWMDSETIGFYKNIIEPSSSFYFHICKTLWPVTNQNRWQSRGKDREERKYNPVKQSTT
jgi:hypothetical protein